MGRGATATGLGITTVGTREGSEIVATLLKMGCEIDLVMMFTRLDGALLRLEGISPLVGTVDDVLDLPSGIMATNYVPRLRHHVDEAKGTGHPAVAATAHRRGVIIVRLHGVDVIVHHHGGVGAIDPCPEVGALSVVGNADDTIK